jgi:thiol-disulfide isomerase/thioredoxin
MNKGLFYLSRKLFAAFSINSQILSIREIKSASEFNSIYNNSKPSIIMFSSPNCSPCKAIEPNLNTISQRHSNIGFYKVDTSKK